MALTIKDVLPLGITEYREVETSVFFINFKQVIQNLINSSAFKNDSSRIKDKPFNYSSCSDGTVQSSSVVKM